MCQPEYSVLKYMYTWVYLQYLIMNVHGTLTLCSCTCTCTFTSRSVLMNVHDTLTLCSCTCTFTSRSVESMSVTPNRDGSYLVNWVPSTSGTYSIKICIDGSSSGTELIHVVASFRLSLGAKTVIVLLCTVFYLHLVQLILYHCTHTCTVHTCTVDVTPNILVSASLYI